MTFSDLIYDKFSFLFDSYMRYEWFLFHGTLANELNWINALQPICIYAHKYNINVKQWWLLPPPDKMPLATSVLFVKAKENAYSCWFSLRLSVACVHI